jgi:hypothetical protein
MPYSPSGPVQRWLGQSRNLDLFLLAACACLLTLLCQPVGRALAASRVTSPLTCPIGSAISYPVSLDRRPGWAVDRA